MILIVLCSDFDRSIYFIVWARRNFISNSLLVARIHFRLVKDYNRRKRMISRLSLIMKKNNGQLSFFEYFLSIETCLKWCAIDIAFQSWFSMCTSYEPDYLINWRCRKKFDRTDFVFHIQIKRISMLSKNYFPWHSIVLTSISFFFHHDFVLR